MYVVLQTDEASMVLKQHECMAIDGERVLGGLARPVRS